MLRNPPQAWLLLVVTAGLLLASGSLGSGILFAPGAPSLSVQTDHSTGRMLVTGSTVAVPALSPVQWQNLTPGLSNSPPCTGDASSAYDPNLEEMVLFGGIGTCTDASQVVNATWTFNDLGWANVTDSLATSPSPRFGAPMAYDPAMHALVLFGGVSTYGFASLGDTWMFNGTWSNLTPRLSVSPTPVGHSAMVYDPELSALVLVGGVFGPGDPQTNATWEFSSAGWTQVANPGALPALQGPSLWYDDATQSVVLFGGTNDTLGVLDETWNFSGTEWTPISSAVTPHAEFDGTALYIGQTPVLFGGNTVGSPVYDPIGYTYEFVNGWVNLTSSLVASPSARSGAAGAWAPALNESVLFGGRTDTGPDGLAGDTWSLSAAPPPPPPFLNVSLAANPSYVSAGDSVTLSTSTSGGTGALSYAYSGLPSGCPSQNLSRIQCAAVPAGAYLVGVTVTSTAGQNATAYAVFVAAPPSGSSGSPIAVSLAASPSFLTVGGSVTLTTTVGGATGVLSYGYTGLPEGCATTNSSTVVCGSVSEGSYLVTVRVTDTSGQSNTSWAVFTAAPMPPTPPSPLPPLVVSLSASPTYLVSGRTVTLSTTVGSSSGPLTFSYAGLPSGCASVNSSSVSCAAVPNGSYLVTVHVTDSTGRNGSAQMVVVAFPPAASPSPPSSGGGNSSNPTVFGLPLSDVAGITLALAVVALALAIVAVLRPRRPAAPPPPN